MPRGEISLDPQSGAELGREREYPFDGTFHITSDRHYHDPPSAVSARTPDRDTFAAWSPDREGALTTGEFHTTAEGLTAHFRRSADAEDDVDPKRARAANLAFKQVFAAYQGPEESRPIDVFAWYTVAQRLHEKGHAVRWMRDHIMPRCPHCRSACKPGYDGVRCASDPNRHGHVRDDIHELVADIYAKVWGDDIERVTAFDPPEAEDA